MRQKGQQLMFSDAELSLINNTFADNEDLIYAIRKVLLQFPLTESEEKILLSGMTPEVYAVVKKRIFPDIDPDAPLFQLSDMYQTLTPLLNSKGVDEMEAQFDAKELEIAYLAQQFAILKDISQGIVSDRAPVIKLDDLAVLTGKTPYEKYVDTTARNYLLSYVDSFLNHVKTIAGQKKETAEETKQRLMRDSSK